MNKLACTMYSSYLTRLCIAHNIKKVDTGHLYFQKWLVIQQCLMDGNNGKWLSLKANVAQNYCSPIAFQQWFIHTSVFYHSVLSRCCSATIENYSHHLCKIIFQRHLMDPPLAYFHLYFLQQYTPSKIRHIVACTFCCPGKSFSSINKLFFFLCWYALFFTWPWFSSCTLTERFSIYMECKFGHTVSLTWEIKFFIFPLNWQTWLHKIYIFQKMEKITQITNCFL